eukprot:TRINITY_DN3886_c0_g1_i1.p1 TRINITY_DN3886_c0_g1~~TRINITY_DN3886_c0_g1_i1.p1  ORF type:complete len:147 (-),score=18.38 TRINITY_DN3886_c0_g1_i1:137-577(-)
MFWTVFIDFITVGCLIATIAWWLSNKYLRVQAIHSVEQSVEWLYAFDIHCNSFFPLFLVLYVLQFFLVPVLIGTLPAFISTLIANSFYLASFGYYCHITYLGYTALPFLQKTQCFLYPIGVFCLLYLVSLILNFNMSIFVMNSYFS